MLGRVFAFAIAALLLLGPITSANAQPVSPREVKPMSRVTTGAERLVSGGFAELAGKRVGLITNHTGLVGSEHLADLMARSGKLTLAAILAPEHGFRGTDEAGAHVRNGRDDKTGVPVLSLYGASKKPTPAMLRGIDVLVFDIQDIGVRYYTYISTMGLAMQAAAEARIPFLVLDRPNPLGGTYVGGFMLEPAQRSFVGQFVIPQAHGLTVGELAQLIKGERLLPGLEQLDLRVLGVQGWTRAMRWPETGLAWVKTSPNVPSFEVALAYAGTGLFEGTAASDGRGTTAPFLTLGAPWASADRLAARLNAARLPGVRFAAAQYTPHAIKGMATGPRFENRAIGGVRIAITDHRLVEPVELAAHLLAAFQAEAQSGKGRLIEKGDWLAKLAGTPRLQQLVERGSEPGQIIAAWAGDVARFKAQRQKYLLY